MAIAQGLKRFGVYNVATGALLHSGNGVYAEEVYEQWRRIDCRPIEYPHPSEGDPNGLEATLASMDSADSWLDDTEVSLRYLGAY